MHGLAGEVANPTAQHRAEPLVSVSDGRQSPRHTGRMKKPRSARERAGLSGTLGGVRRDASNGKPTVTIIDCCAHKSPGVGSPLGDSSPALRSGRSPDWLNFKNPEAPAGKREAQEDWAKFLERSVRRKV
jgi:hypothetical protein